MNRKRGDVVVEVVIALRLPRMARSDDELGAVAKSITQSGIGRIWEKDWVESIDWISVTPPLGEKSVAESSHPGEREP